MNIVGVFTVRVELLQMALAPQTESSFGQENVPFPETENSIEDKTGKIARKKWGLALDAGYQIIPDVLFRSQRLLNLKPVDVVILLNITTHWWEYDDLPHPRPSVIAKRMSLTTRTVERRIAELQKDGFLKRLPAEQKSGKTVRKFDLTGLVEKLQELSVQNLVRRRSQRAPMMTARRRRKTD